MHRILVILTNTQTARACLAACLKLAGSYAAAELTLLHVRPEQDPDFIPGTQLYTEERRAAFEVMRDTVFDELSRAVAPWHDKGFPGLQQMRGKLDETAKRAAAVADLVIMGGPHADPEAKIILECACLDADKPVILISRNAPASVGQNIAIAWASGEGSPRVVDAILPLLTRAGQLTLLMGTSGNDLLGEPPREILLALEATSRDLRMHVFEFADRHIGEALLSEAHDVGADLLVMGAFTRSHLREAVFGGATAEILQDLDMPLLIQH